MKSLDRLFTNLLLDVGEYCSVDTTRDLQYMKSRARHEGESFYTITLPDFAQSIEDAIEQGQVSSTHFLGFKKRGCLPAFMQGFTRNMFDVTGAVKESDDVFITSLYCARQFCRFAKKLLRPCTSTREKLAFSKYVETDVGLPSPRDSVSTYEYGHFCRTAKTIWSTVFGNESVFDLVPRHGPGATAQRISGNQKYRIREWHRRLERQFPYAGFAVHSENVFGDESITAKFLSSEKERPVRVISVPKTLKTPRIIAIEPVCMQYTQQAVSRYITKSIARSPLVGCSIHFNDQTVNQEMAIKASSDRSLATIDLSEASDRVHLHGVVDMLNCVPWLLKATLACRSMSADVPNFGKLKLRKFASMGSALCFPIESMYFYTVIVHSLLQSRGLPVTTHSIKSLSSEVYVFGDDIIIPTHETDTVIEALSRFGAKVNVTKSHWKSSFRESCGVDAIKGVNITPVYLRRSLKSRRDSSGILSTVATSNQLFKAGLWRASDYLKQVVERLLGRLPIVLEDSPGLGWFSFLGLSSENECWCIHHQKPLVWTYTVRTKKVRDVLDGYPALLKFFITEKSEDKEHLEYSSRHGVVSRKRRGVSAI